MLRSGLELHDLMLQFLLLRPIFSSLSLPLPLLPHPCLIPFPLLKPKSSSCLFVQHQLPCTLLGSLFLAPTISVTFLTPLSLSTPQVLSAMFLMVPTIPSHTPSSLLFGQLMPDLTSPKSASFSLLVQQVLLLHPGSWSLMPVSSSSSAQLFSR